MAVPKQKSSKSRTRRRRSINGRIKIANLILCNSCGNSKLAHRVCSSCGFYRGKQVLEIN